MLIFAACVPLLVKRIMPWSMVLITVIVVNFTLLGLFKQHLDPKPVRDVLIPVVFFWLGHNVGNSRLADRILVVVIGIVALFAIFELAFLEQYTKFFDITHYFASRGLLTQQALSWVQSGLGESGMRLGSEGRNILPMLLGNHRVSSVFLEPVSMGNFCVIVAAWGLAKERGEWRKTVGYVLAALMFVILSDSRFGLIAVAGLCILRLFDNRERGVIGFNAVLMSLALTCAVGAYRGYRGLADNFLGRVTLGGLALIGFDERYWLGLVANVKAFSDMGYAYAFANFGVILCLLLWAALWLIPLASEEAKRFRTYISIYIALILPISGTSLFALKTAGLMWFLLGSLSMSKAVNVGKQRDSQVSAPPPGVFSLPNARTDRL